MSSKQALVLGSLVLLACGAPAAIASSQTAYGGIGATISTFVAENPQRAGTPPPPPPKFWSVSRCEQEVRVHDRVVTAQGYGFHVGLEVCVGTGGPQACEWASDYHSRRYSQFRVFSRSRYVGGVVRSWTLATRGGYGLVAILAHAGDPYVGWPAEFFMSPVSVRVLAGNATPARFRSLVAPIAARLTRQQNATGCTAG